LSAPGVSLAAPASPEDWERIAQGYDVAGEFVNLENAYYGIMARPVLDEFKRNIDFLNRYNSMHLRRS
jgi:hypothetical protein